MPENQIPDSAFFALFHQKMAEAWDQANVQKIMQKKINKMSEQPIGWNHFMYMLAAKTQQEKINQKLADSQQNVIYLPEYTTYEDKGGCDPNDFLEHLKMIQSHAPRPVRLLIPMGCRKQGANGVGHMCPMVVDINQDGKVNLLTIDPLGNGNGENSFLHEADSLIGKVKEVFGENNIVIHSVADKRFQQDSFRCGDWTQYFLDQAANYLVKHPAKNLAEYAEAIKNTPTLSNDASKLFAAKLRAHHQSNLLKPNMKLNTAKLRKHDISPPQEVIRRAIDMDAAYIDKTVAAIEQASIAENKDPIINSDVEILNILDNKREADNLVTNGIEDMQQTVTTINSIINGDDGLRNVLENSESIESSVAELAEQQLAKKLQITGSKKSNQIMNISPEGDEFSSVTRKFLDQLTSKLPLKNHEVYYLGAIKPSIFDMLKTQDKETGETIDMLDILGGSLAIFKDMKNLLLGNTDAASEIRVAIHKKTGDVTFYSKPNDAGLDRMIAIAEKICEKQKHQNKRFLISCKNEKTCKKLAEKLQAAGLVPVIDQKNPAAAMKLYNELKAKGPAALSTKVLSKLESNRADPEINSFLNKYYADNPKELGRQLPGKNAGTTMQQDNIQTPPTPPLPEPALPSGLEHLGARISNVDHIPAISAIGDIAGPGGVHSIERNISDLKGEITTLNAKIEATDLQTCNNSKLEDYFESYIALGDKCEELQKNNELSPAQHEAVASILKQCNAQIQCVNDELGNRRQHLPDSGQSPAAP